MRTRWKAVAVLIVCTAGAATAAVRLGGESRLALTADSRPLAGQRAGGGSFDLRELHGTPTVIVFYRGSHCPLCMQRLQALNQRAAAYERLGARLLAVTADDTETATRTARELGLDYPIVSVDSRVLREWGVLDQGATVPTPAEFVLGGDGATYFVHHGHGAGYVGDVELIGAVRSLLAERTAEQ